MWLRKSSEDRAQEFTENFLENVTPGPAESDGDGGYGSEDAVRGSVRAEAPEPTQPRSAGACSLERGLRRVSGRKEERGALRAQMEKGSGFYIYIVF